MADMKRDAGAAETMFGVSAALTTPFDADFSVDLRRLADHAGQLLEDGCASVTLFGTTGEGASLVESERKAALGAFAGAGIDPARLVVGISATAVEQAVDQAFVALDAGLETLLVPPPFYFKGISEEGLFAWYAGFFERIGRRAPRVLLYHIPQVTAVGLSPALVGRLKHRYGHLVLGVKDSGGHWPATEAFLNMPDLWVLVGDERHLARAVRLGGAGAISGMANVFPKILCDLVRTGRDDPWLIEVVDSLKPLSITPAIKALVGIKRQDDAWNRVRAPLEPIQAADLRILRNHVNDFERTRAAES